MSKFDIVIFDWAGTTVDYGCFAPVAAFERAFETYGIKPTTDEIREPMGMLKLDHIKEMLKMDRINKLWQEKYQREWTDEDADKIHETFLEILLESLRDYADPKPGVTKGIQKLKEAGLPIGSTTGFTTEMMNIVRPAAKEKGYDPDYLVTPDDVNGKGRPYPYMIFKNMMHFEIEDVRRVIKVGDTVSDIKEGKNAGVFSAAIIEGSSVLGLTEKEFQSLDIKERERQIQFVHQKFIDAGADRIFLNMEECIQFILA